LPFLILPDTGMGSREIKENYGRGELNYDIL
jgi:hypothetical protein